MTLRRHMTQRVRVWIPWGLVMQWSGVERPPMMQLPKPGLQRCRGSCGLATYANEERLDDPEVCHILSRSSARVAPLLLPAMGQVITRPGERPTSHEGFFCRIAVLELRDSTCSVAIRAMHRFRFRVGHVASYDIGGKTAIRYVDGSFNENLRLRDLRAGNLREFRSIAQKPAKPQSQTFQIINILPGIAGRRGRRTATS